MATLSDLRARIPELEGLGDEAAVSYIHQVYYPSRRPEEVAQRLGFKAPPPPAKPRGALAFANDTVIDFSNAAAGGVSAVGDFIAPGNRVSKYIDKNIIEAGKASQSDAARAEDARYQQAMQDAQGFGDEALTTLGYAARNPIRTLATAAGSFVGPGAAVKGARGMAGALGAGERGLVRAGMAGGATAGAAMAGGDAAGTAYDLAIKAGATEEQAIAAARQASVIPAMVGGAGGLVGAEHLLAGGKGFAGGRIAQALKTGAVEAGQEGFEEGITQYEGQRAAMPFDPSIDPMRGVGGAATMGAVLGGATGAGMSALTYRKPGDVLRDEGLQPEIGPATRSLNAAVEAAAVKVDQGAAMVPADTTGGAATAEVPAVPAVPADPVTQREADRPPEPIGQVQPGDILTKSGAPFKNMENAMAAQARAGEGHEIVRVAKGLVVRKKEGTQDGQPGLAAPTGVPDGSPDGASVESGRSAGPALGGGGIGPGRVDTAAGSPAPSGGQVVPVRDAGQPYPSLTGKTDAEKFAEARARILALRERNLGARIPQPKKGDTVITPAGEGTVNNAKFDTVAVSVNNATRTFPPGQVFVIDPKPKAPDGNQEATQAQPSTSQEASQSPDAQGLLTPKNAAGSQTQTPPREAPTQRAGAAEAAETTAVPGPADTAGQDAGLNAAFDFAPPTDGSRQNLKSDVRVGDSTISYGVKDDGTIKVYSLRTPTAKRRLGSGRAAMDALLAQADADGRAVVLDSSPLDARTNGGKLTRFYESLGFKKTGAKINAVGDPEMRRAPTAVAPDEKASPVGRAPETVAERADSTIPVAESRTPDQPTQAQAGTPAEGAGASRPTPAAAPETDAERTARIRATPPAQRTDADLNWAQSRDRAAREQLAAADEAERAAKKEANKGRSVVERRANAILDGPNKLPPEAGLGTGTRRDAMDKAVEQSRAVVAVTVQDIAAKKRDQQAIEDGRRRDLIPNLTNPNAPGMADLNAAAARLKANKYEKLEYRVYGGLKQDGPYYVISKTEHDYAQERKAAPPPEPAAAPAPAEPAQLSPKAQAVKAIEDRKTALKALLLCLRGGK